MVLGSGHMIQFLFLGGNGLQKVVVGEDEGTENREVRGLKGEALSPWPQLRDWSLRLF